MTLGACSKDRVAPPDPSPIATTTDPGRIEISAELDESFALDMEDQDNLRALSIYQKDNDGNGVDADDPFTFDIDIAKYGTKKMHLFLRRRGSTHITSVFAPVTITKNANGRYSMKAVLENVVPAGGLSFASGEWYICGFWGGGDQPATTATSSLVHRVEEVKPVSPYRLGDKMEMDIPLGFPWTKITGVQKGPVFLMQHFDLKIRPMGIVLSLRLNNRTQYEVDLESLDKEMTGFALGGTFDISSTVDTDLTSGSFPKFRPFPSGVNNKDNETVNILPRRLSLNSGSKAGMPIYMWMMPTDVPPSTSTSPKRFLTFTFVSVERTTMDATLNPKDRFNMHGVGKLRDRYVIDLEFKRVPSNSKYFIKEAKIKSGLMITEYFINGYTINGKDLRYKDVREPNFHGYVELYNPNLDPILLENYALAKITNLRRTFVNEEDGTTYPGRSYGFFHPFAIDRYSEWETGKFVGHPEGRADLHADSKTQSHKAVLISLQLKNNAKSSFQPNSLGFRSPKETASGAIEPLLQADASNDDRVERVRFLKGGLDSDGKARLQGGKTMLLLGNAYLETGNPSDIPYYKYEYYNYKDKRWEYGNFPPTHKISPTDWSRIVGGNECQIVVALDNYIQRDAYALYKDAGVMNIGWSDALFIVQKHPKDNTRRRVVDATSAHPFARVDNWLEFSQKVALINDNPRARSHFRVRTVAQRMPEFLNFDYPQWYSVPFEGTIPTTVVSPGRRSAASF